LPGNIPENLEVDISHLNLGDSLRAEDYDLDENFSLKTDGSQTIASVTQAMKEEVKEDVVEEDGLDTEASSADVTAGDSGDESESNQGEKEE
jgi:large subunit ribosomal protein L25